MSKVWEDTDGCANKYRCNLDIYLMTVLSSPYVIIMDSAINSPFHGKNFVGGINPMYKRYMEGEMELIGKLGSNDTSRIGMLPSHSKHVSIKFPDQCMHIINNK